MIDNEKAGSGRGNNRRGGRRRSSRRPDKNNLRTEYQTSPQHSHETYAGSDRTQRSMNENQKDRNRHGKGRRKDRNHRGNFPSSDSGIFRKEKVSMVDRPKWLPPAASAEPLPALTCPWCGKPIDDASALTDKETGAAIHFDCVAVLLASKETLEPGEKLTYIGGGRFAIVTFIGTENDSRKPDNRFTIKKVIEWETQNERAEWRAVYCNRYSTT